MATAIIQIVIGKLAGAVVGKLGEIAVEEVASQASLLLHFRRDFEWLQRKLKNVTEYLQYADDLYVKNKLVKEWVGKVQDIAFDAENIVDECAVSRDSFILRSKMGRKIKKIKDRMESVMEDAVELQLVRGIFNDSQFHTFHGSDDRKQSGLLERDARPVAIDAKVDQIIHLLEENATQVIAVVGMGGIGKTFLLKNVYNHSKVQQRFPKAIWLSVSQVYSVATLQYDIASHLDLSDHVKAGGVTEQRAAELIHKKLKDKSSLVVLDDVWKVKGVNNLLQKLGIPGGTNNPCKVVVTTRSIDVCNIMGAAQIYNMELLSEEDSWNLFCLHAFPDHQPPEELNDVAHQVERECSRLPLAIKAVAASMASQKLLSDWNSKLQQLKEVSDSNDSIMAILGLSYNVLPSALKPCFLSISFFGENVEIDAEYLIYLWIGEGFIPKGKDQWSTGWSYLKQLNNLCLVEVTEDKESRSSCKIHDLLLDLIISITKENKCAFTVEKASAVGCRRAFLAKKDLDDAGIRNLKRPKSLRTLSLSQNNIRKLPTKSIKGVQALRVIDLSNTDICLLPRCMGNLNRLSALNLSNAWFDERVPDCVRNLNSLCFLNVDGCRLPKWIGKLKSLQHLHVERVNYSRKVSAAVSKLVSLRTLRTVYQCFLILKDVATLIHLEELRLDLANEEEEKSL